MSDETKIETEEVNSNEDSTYLIEVLHQEEEDEDLGQEEYVVKVSESNNGKDSHSDTEDAVSFLKNVKREDVVSDTKKSFKMVRKNHSCNYCKKRFLRKSNLVDHLRLHANVSLTRVN